MIDGVFKSDAAVLTLEFLLKGRGTVFSLLWNIYCTPRLLNLVHDFSLRRENADETSLLFLYS